MELIAVVFLFIHFCLEISAVSAALVPVNPASALMADLAFDNNRVPKLVAASTLSRKVSTTSQELHGNLRIPKACRIDLGRLGGKGKDMVPPLAHHEVFFTHDFNYLCFLGMGAHSETFLVRDAISNTVIALKRMDKGIKLEKATKEYDMLSNPAAGLGVDGFKPFENGGNSYIPMKFIEGKTWSSLIKEKALTTSQNMVILEKAEAKLRQLHEADIAHVDLHPGNIIITHDLEPVLIDYGMARNLDSLDSKSKESIKNADFFALPSHQYLEKSLKV